MKNTTGKMSESIGSKGESQVSDLAQRAEALAAMARDLAEQVRLAKGTRPMPVVAPVAGTTRRARPDEGRYGLKGKDLAAAMPATEPTERLYERVASALESKPMPFRELMSALGPDINENRVKGILVRLQRDGRGVVNLGNGARAIWWIDRHGRLAEIAASAAKRIMSPKR
jgi:hypothetical protein